MNEIELELKKIREFLMESNVILAHALKLAKRKQREAAKKWIKES